MACLNNTDVLTNGNLHIKGSGKVWRGLLRSLVVETAGASVWGCANDTRGVVEYIYVSSVDRIRIESDLA